jgi:hypothetical protein
VLAEFFLEHGPHGLGRFHEGGLVHVVVDLALPLSRILSQYWFSSCCTGRAASRGLRMRFLD